MPSTPTPLRGATSVASKGVMGVSDRTLHRYATTELGFGQRPATVASVGSSEYQRVMVCSACQTPPLCESGWRDLNPRPLRPE